jgi:hypothetical protein
MVNRKMPAGRINPLTGWAFVGEAFLGWEFPSPFHEESIDEQKAKVMWISYGLPKSKKGEAYVKDLREISLESGSVSILMGGSSSDISPGNPHRCRRATLPECSHL